MYSVLITSFYQLQSANVQYFHFSTVFMFLSQGCRLHLLWNDHWQTSVPWIHSGGWASPHIPHPRCDFPTVMLMFMCGCAHYTSTHLVLCDWSGTPTEETWPGITTSEEFKTYNFSQYQAEPLVNHAPRCVDEFPTAQMDTWFENKTYNGQNAQDSDLKSDLCSRILLSFLLFVTQDRQRWSWLAVDASSGI